MENAVAAAEVCKQVSKLATKHRSIDEIATMPTIDAIDTILGYLDQVQLLREQWERVESAGWLCGYTWDTPFKTASTATGSALQQSQSNCYRIAKRLELLGHFPLDEPIGKTMSKLLNQPNIDFESFIKFSIETIKRRVPVLVVARIDDERRYILETKTRSELSNELATVEADRLEIERKREIEHERELDKKTEAALGIPRFVEHPFVANRETFERVGNRQKAFFDAIEIIAATVGTGSQTSRDEPKNTESLDRQTPTTIFETGSKHCRPTASELVRLIRRLIDRLRDGSLADRRWQYSQVDALTDKMMALWAELGIDQPGMWVDSGSDYGQQTPCKLFQVRDPDLQETQSVMLEHGVGDNRYVFSVRDVGAMLPEILTWEQWLEQRFEIAPVSQNERLALSLLKTSAMGAASRAESVTLDVTAVQSAQSAKKELSKIRLRMDLLDQYPPTKFKRRTLPDDGKTAYAYLASEKKRNPNLWEAESKSFRESTGRDFLWLKGT